MTIELSDAGSDPVWLSSLGVPDVMLDFFHLSISLAAPSLRSGLWHYPSFLSFFTFRKNAENMYYFSELALTLNAWEGGTAPTDSRLRPDQRLMENGRWDEANAEKQRLEEKQRLSRKKREAEAMKATEDGNELALCSYFSMHRERQL